MNLSPSHPSAVSSKPGAHEGSDMHGAPQGFILVAYLEDNAEQAASSLTSRFWDYLDAAATAGRSLCPTDHLDQLPSQQRPELLELSYRQSKRIWARYRAGGAKALQHGNCERVSNRAYTGKFRAAVLKRVQSPL